MNKMTTIYLVRHAQTEWNTQDKLQGHLDSPLTKSGKKAARLLGEKFKNINFDMIFSSDLLRAQRTAEIIVLEKKLAVQTTELLRERNYGEYDGKPAKSIETVNKMVSKLNAAKRYSYKHSEKLESDKEVVDRIIPFLREVSIANPGKTILIVSHGTSIRLALMKLGFGEYPHSLPPGALKNVGWAKIETDGVDFFIKEYEGINFSN